MKKPKVKITLPAQAFWLTGDVQADVRGQWHEQTSESTWELWANRERHKAEARWLAAHPGGDYWGRPNEDGRDEDEQEFLDGQFKNWLREEAPGEIKELFAQQTHAGSRPGSAKKATQQKAWQKKKPRKASRKK